MMKRKERGGEGINEIKGEENKRGKCERRKTEEGMRVRGTENEGEE